MKEAIKIKSVQSDNPFKSVVQTTYDIVKAHGGEINVMPADGEAGIKFLVAIPIKSIQ